MSSTERNGRYLKRRHFWFSFLAVIVVFGLAAAYAAYWRYVAGELERGIENWAVAERAAGRDVTFSPGGITGFPFAFRRDFTDLQLSQPAADGALTISAARVVATMRPWNLRVILFAGDAPATVELLSPTQGARSITAGAVEGEIRLLANGRLEAIKLRALKLDVDDDGEFYKVEQANLGLSLPPLTPRAHTDDLLGFDLALEGLTLPAGRVALTAEQIEHLAASGRVLGPVPSGLPPRAAVAQWAAAGGTLELKSFRFHQAPLDLEGEGTLALDEAQQILGALTIRAQGLSETIDLLVGQGLIDPNSAKTGRLMAEGLAKPDDKGRKVVNVALSLQQGFVWLGPIRLTPLPVLTW